MKDTKTFLYIEVILPNFFFCLKIDYFIAKY